MVVVCGACLPRHGSGYVWSEEMSSAWCEGVHGWYKHIHTVSQTCALHILLWKLRYGEHHLNLVWTYTDFV